MEYAILIIAWCVWCSLHSLLIALPVTNYLKAKLGTNYRFYRLFYNLFALATLIPVILYEESLKTQVIFRWDGFFWIFRFVLITIALLLFVSGAMKFDMLHFFWHPTDSIGEIVFGFIQNQRHRYFGDSQPNTASLVFGDNPPGLGGVPRIVCFYIHCEHYPHNLRNDRDRSGRTKTHCGVWG